MNSLFVYLPNSLDERPAFTGAPPEVFARYRRNVTIAILANVATIFAATSIDGPHWLKAGLWIVEFAAMCALVAIYVRYVTSWDELQRRIFVTAAANALLVTFLALFANLIAPRIGLPSIDPVLISIVPPVAFVICRFVAQRRYA